jgi:hypothetical protein
MQMQIRKQIWMEVAGVLRINDGRFIPACFSFLVATDSHNFSFSKSQCTMATTTPTGRVRTLFGGAITCQLTPDDDWRDVSDIRQVPDHQECWQDIEGRLLVVEILDRQSNVTDEQAAAYFFQDLAEANGMKAPDLKFYPQPELTNTSNMNSAAGLPDSAKVCFGTGYQKVALGKEHDIAGNPRTQQVQSIRVELCAIRLPSVGTELLTTLSSPSDENLQETSSQPTEAFARILGSFQIQDWTLFG